MIIAHVSSSDWVTLIYRTKFPWRADDGWCVWVRIATGARTWRSRAPRPGSALDALRRLAFDGGNHSTFFISRPKQFICDASGPGSPMPSSCPSKGQARGVQIDIEPDMLSLRYPMEVNRVARRGRGGNVAPTAQSKRSSKVARGGRKASRGGSSWATGDAAVRIVQSAARRVGDMALIGHLCHRPVFNPLPEPGLRVRRCVGQPHPRRVAFRRRHKPDPRSTISRARSGFSVALSEGRRPSAV